MSWSPTTQLGQLLFRGNGWKAVDVEDMDDTEIKMAALTAPCPSITSSHGSGKQHQAAQMQ